MYLPRNLIAHLYQNLIKRTHAAAPPVLLLVALEPDALCACRILTALLKRDYIPHKIQPIAGYGDLSRAAEDLVRPMRTTDGGSVVICLGVGGMVDMEEILGLDVDENGEGGTGDVEVWLLDARRPWNLTNVFAAPISQDPATGEFVRRQAGVDKGKILHSYQSKKSYRRSVKHMPALKRCQRWERKTTLAMTRTTRMMRNRLLDKHQRRGSHGARRTTLRMR